MSFKDDGLEYRDLRSWNETHVPSDSFNPIPCEWMAYPCVETKSSSCLDHDVPGVTISSKTEK